MKITTSLLRKWKALADGERLPHSQLRGEWLEDCINDGVIVSISNGSRKTYYSPDTDAFRLFLSSRYEINDIEERISLFENKDEITRGMMAAGSGDSKIVTVKTFPGFPVNVIEDIDIIIDEKPIKLQANPGMFYFISDFARLRIPTDVIVIGIENAENFRFPEKMGYLFNDLREKVLFVSRYPQSKDLGEWLKSIPNRYLHFGDFDLAGINIFLTEFHNKLGRRAEFFIPSDIEDRLARGSRKRYDSQLTKYGKMKISDERLLWLVEKIHQYKRAYDQEGYLE